MTRHAKEALHAYVVARKQKRDWQPEPWTPADKTDAFVAICCAVLFIWLVVLA